MKITYKMTRLDVQESYRIGIPRMSLGWWLLLTGYLLACASGLLWLLWAEGYHAHWPPTGPFPWHTLAFTLAGLCFGLSTFFPLMLFACLLSPRLTVRIDPLTFTTERGGGRAKLKWKEVREILDTGEYLCFRTYLPAVTVVPRSAFPNNEQARAFAEQAGLYWRRATGRKDPQALNSLGVWPPAPSAANFQASNGKP